jgi:hypothetical protein
MSARHSALVRCRSCAFENRRDAARCFLCGESLAGAEAVAPRVRPGGALLPAPLQKQARATEARESAFHQLDSRLNPLMLAIAVIAVSIGLAQMAPGLAGVFAVIAVVAMAATVAAVEFHDTWLNGLVAVLVTVVVLVVVAIAGFSAFFATCIAIASASAKPGGEFSGGGNVLGGLCVGGLVGVLVAVVLWKLIMRRFR